jgi:hypothetical protein
MQTAFAMRDAGNMPWMPCGGCISAHWSRHCSPQRPPRSKPSPNRLRPESQVWKPVRSVDRNGCTGERVNIAETRLFARDRLCSGEKMRRASASVDTLQIVIN